MMTRLRSMPSWAKIACCISPVRPAAQDQVDGPSEIDGGQIDDGTDAAAVEVGHLPLGDVQDAVPVPKMGPVLLDSGGARDDVLVHQGWPELGRGDRAQRGLDGCHLDLLYRVQTSSTGFLPPTAARP